MREHHHPHHREHGVDPDGFEKRPGRERAGRGPRVFAPGDLKLLLLALIADQPCHGYDLIRQIETLFDGAYSPSPGVIYPTLTFLEESEMITGDTEGGKNAIPSPTPVISHWPSKPLRWKACACALMSASAAARPRPAG